MQLVGVRVEGEGVGRHRYLGTKDILVQEDNTEESKPETNSQNFANVF